MPTRTDRTVKKLKHIVNWTVWGLLALYLVVLLMIHLPAIQQYMGRKAADVLSETLGTDVRVERIELGFLNRLVLDDVVIKDQSDEELLRVGRLAIKMDLLPLLEGHISISSAQVFGAHATLYKTDSLAPPNYQFVIDSLASADTTSQNTLRLRINSLIIRQSSIAYDEHYMPTTPRQFNTHHLYVKDISAHMLMKCIQDDSLNINIKRLAFNEQSGLNVNRLALRMEANNHEALIENFRLQLPQSVIAVDSICATYNKEALPASLRYRVHLTSTLTPADLACFLPQLGAFSQHLDISTSVSGSTDMLACPQLSILANDQSLELQASGEFTNLHRQPTGWLNIHTMKIGTSLLTQCKESFNELPNELPRMGNIHLSGELQTTDQGTLNSSARLRTDAGNVFLLFATTDRQHFSAQIETDSLQLGRLLDDGNFGKMATHIRIEGTNNHFNALGQIALLEYKNYPYRDVDLDAHWQNGDISGRLRIDDSNVQADIDGELRRGRRSTIRLTGFIKNLHPSALHLTDRWGDTRFSAIVDADFTASNLNDAEGNFDLDDFEMISNDSLGSYYHLDNLHVKSGYNDKEHFFKVKGDMGEAEIKGSFDWNTLPQSFISYIASKLPTLPGLPETARTAGNNFEARLTMTDADWIQKLMGITISLERPLRLWASVDDTNHLIDVKGMLPKFTYNGNRYQNADINISTMRDTMTYNICLTKVMDDDGLMDLALTGHAADNNLSASLHWNHTTQTPENAMFGTINTITQLYTNSQGYSEAHIRVLPSQMMVRGTPWNLEPCDILYSSNRLMVDHFSLNHERQHLIIDGIASASAADLIVVDMNELEVGYIMDLVNFHSVSFEGLATGRAYASQVFGDFTAQAELAVDKFRFENGRMGVLMAKAEWNREQSQIDIQAVADDGEDVQTFIDGYISPVREDINLDIRAQGSNVEFCKTYTSSFLSQLEGNTFGNLKLSGPLGAMNLTGQLVVDGKATVTALNTTYTMQNDTILFVPNDIQMLHCALTDKEGNTAYLSGGVHHENLSNLTFDLEVEAHNLLAYDFQNFNDGIVCGTVYATGTADLHGRPGEVVINCDVTPQPNSVFAYNAANPDAISQQEFITWGHPSAGDNTKKHVSTSLASGTNIYINFIINAIPAATLKVLMDAKTNDYITLNGSGIIKATFYNKGPFHMFGTYTVDRGTYGITIQNIIKKNFIFQNGGTIVFGGDPFNANLNLQAQYTVNGVSLSDLNLGNSFSSNTVRVNCLMNVQGTPGSPRVDFDFEMPNVNNEEEQMIRSVITSEQEMNQQVLYLLGIGRFYTQRANNAQAQEYGQTQLAMQSFLSGTVSSQINEVLSQVIKSNDWNFGANISTGNEGWHNAEYEGLISGRMLNNRLLINGQFGYRDNATQTTPSFIGDFDIQYLLNPNGNLAVKVYNQTNDRYFTRSSLNTQGVGLVMKKDFNTLRDLFHKTRNSSSARPPQR